MVREEFIRHTERFMQVLPPSDSRPSPSSPRQPPPAELIGCVTQSRDEVNAWVRSNAGVLLRSGRGFDRAVYQEMHSGGRREGRHVRVIEPG